MKHNITEDKIGKTYKKDKHIQLRYRPYSVYVKYWQFLLT